MAQVEKEDEKKNVFQLKSKFSHKLLVQDISGLITIKFRISLKQNSFPNKQFINKCKSILIRKDPDKIIF